MIHQHAAAALGRGRFGVEGGLQQVDPLEVFDHDALGPQVVAPDLLDELGVVPPLDQDAARTGDPRVSRERRTNRMPSAAAPARRPVRAGEDDVGAVDEKPGAEREQPPPAVPVLQFHQAGGDPDHGAAEPVGGHLDDRVGGGLHPGTAGRPWVRQPSASTSVP